MANEVKRGTDQILLSIKGSSTSATANLDTQGAKHATIRVLFDTRLNTDAATCAVNLLECDTTVVTDFVTIVAQRAEDMTNRHEVRYEVDLRSHKRYLRLTVDPGNTTNDVATCIALATLSRKETDPTAAADLVGSTNDAVVIV